MHFNWKVNSGLSRTLKLTWIKKLSFTIPFLILPNKLSDTFHSNGSNSMIRMMMMTSFSTGNNHNSNIPNNSNSNSQNEKTLELQQQWAGGRDIWPRVPLDFNQTTFTSIQTRVANKKNTKNSSSNNNTVSSSCHSWPDVVQSHILYGFGAYNPRGTIVEDEINQKQHERLKQDILQSLVQEDPRNMDTDNKLFQTSKFLWWEGASIWEDGSWELGFILAFTKETAEYGLKMSMELAKKYNQGAIYKFEFVKDDSDGDHDDDHMQNGRLIRETIPVLDEGTEAEVEIEMEEEELKVDLSQIFDGSF